MPETSADPAVTDGGVPSPADMPASVEPAAETDPTAAEPSQETPETDWKAQARKWESRAKSNRAEQQQAAETLAAIMKAINPDADTSKPDPEALAAQLAERDTAVRQAQTELAIYRSAVTAGADPDALTDSRRFMDAADALDPSSDTYTDDLANLIRETLDSSPHLAAQPKVTRSTSEIGPSTAKVEDETDPTKLAELIRKKRNF